MAIALAIPATAHYRRRRILIVSTFFPPLNSMASLRPYSWARYWAEEGHEITVLTTAKGDRPSAELGLPPCGCPVLEVPVAAASFLRHLHARAAAPAAGSGWRPARAVAAAFERLRQRTGAFASVRMPDLSDLWVRPALRALPASHTWDIVVSTGGPYAPHIVAGRLKRSRRARRWVADYRDLWTDDTAWSGLWPLRAWERRWETRLLAAADLITTVSRPLADVLSRRHRRLVQVVENGFDPSDVATLDAAPAYPSDGKLRLVYTGSLHPRREVNTLLQALADLARDPAGTAALERLEVLLATPVAGGLRELIDAHGVGRWVRAIGFVDRPVALRMQRDADFLLFFPWNEPGTDGIMTGKIYEYLYWGSPILMVGCPRVEASQRLALDAGVGVRLPDVARVKAYLLEQLRGDKPRRRQARPDFIRRYDRRALSHNLLDLALALDRSTSS